MVYSLADKEKAFLDSPGNTCRQPVTDPGVAPNVVWLIHLSGVPFVPPALLLAPGLTLTH